MSYKGDGPYTYCDVCGNRVEVMDCGCETTCNVCRLADEVNKGMHGDGEERKESLGDDYNEVQNEINRRYGYNKRY